MLIAPASVTIILPPRVEVLDVGVGRVDERGGVEVAEVMVDELRNRARARRRSRRPRQNEKTCVGPFCDQPYVPRWPGRDKATRSVLRLRRSRHRDAGGFTRKKCSILSAGIGTALRRDTNIGG